MNSYTTELLNLGMNFHHTNALFNLEMNSTYTIPTTTSNWTFDDLERLNDAKADALLPAMLVIGCYMVVGITGNALVCYVMGFKLKTNTQNILIVYLAVFDLLSCLICMPADIHDMRHYYYFPSEIGCKIVRMAMSFTSEASIFTLLVIAGDRYRKICTPMKSQMSLRHTKWFLILILFAALFISCPALIIFGFRTIDTGIPVIPGHDCSISDTLKDTLYPMVYSSTLFLLFIIISICLSVLYTLVLAAARRHRRYMSSNLNPNHFKCPSTSIRGMKYTKNNHSNSATITEDTTGTRRSSESLSHASALKVNNGGDYPLDPNDTSSRSREHFNEDGGLCIVRKSCDNLDTLGLSKRHYREILNTTIIKNCEKREASQEETESDKVSTPFGTWHGLDNSLQQRLMTQNSNSSLGLESTKNPGDHFQKRPSNGSPNEVHTFHTNRASRNVQVSDEKARSIETQSVDNHITPSLQIKDNIHKGNISASDDDTMDEKSRVMKKKKKRSFKISKLDRKTTLIAFLVTIVFILSYLPYLSLQISKQIVEGLDYELQGASLVFYNIFLRSYYINSFSNPIIYGFLNKRFRRQLRILLSKAFRTHRSRSRSSHGVK